MTTFKMHDAAVFSGLVRSSEPKFPGGIYGITSGDFGLNHVEAAKAMLQGGIKTIQYRPKEYADFSAMVQEGSQIKEMCRDHGSVFIVNDSIELAKRLDADGIHLGQEDMPLAQARVQLGGKIIGISVSTVEQAIAAYEGGADYIGVGPVFPTRTKGKEKAIGIDALWKIVDALKERGSDMPIVPIGSLKIGHIQELRSDAYAVAVRSEVLEAGNKVEAAASLIREWERCSPTL